jgi:hypothetical protein
LHALLSEREDFAKGREGSGSGRRDVFFGFRRLSILLRMRDILFGFTRFGLYFFGVYASEIKVFMVFWHTGIKRQSVSGVFKKERKNHYCTAMPRIDFYTDVFPFYIVCVCVWVLNH